MVNHFIINLFWIVITLSAVSVVAEMLCRRNSKPYRFFRAIWIRLRELSPLSFSVTAILLLFWGLVSGDDNFYGIWMAVTMMFTALIILYAEDFFTFRKKRKKAQKKTALPAIPEKTASYPPAHKAAILTPIAPENGQ